MRLGIIGAMEEEVSLLKKRMSGVETIEIAGCRFYRGIIEKTEVVLLQSGIGKVSAAVGTTLLLDHYHPEAVINTGSAGGTDPSLSIGDVVISSSVIHHDADATAFDYVPGQIPGMPPAFLPDHKLIEAAIVAGSADSTHQIVKGLIGSGDSFMSDPVRILKLKETFPELKAVEMEAAAIAQVCHQFKVPFLIIRSLSDIAGKDSNRSFDQFLETAAKHSAEFILSIVKELNS
ncbi:5'-methylthioadenosine/S-adenosylhomocysteine nucleosidase [Sporolactobacillus inulinus]|uniref:5'-methylthioadenosine/S-adenosylhomocysteine nucleosidase n=1 Tax=Sporolactobacillus inulinus CASD TaxID=1069536 RepID=A0A0U1QQY8_9BACL|nr:5'-methylthioadenosine/S-adenosylhomocysteine nucleosidase [Sporolactobacillus inulinus]KLI03219.1 5'-methylthioadenosine nucleosidase [Sporolactobacillus inulinus CASD]GEB76211.1 5'-methylthioadenosine/S-adenosylhomocysteine nucleosidase [Sporolactobacillus inulinus]